MLSDFKSFLNKNRYDISKIKTFNLVRPEGTVVKIYSKRIEGAETEEIARARRAYEAGIPTPKVLGEIQDKGNLYAWFEAIEGRDLNTIISRLHLDRIHNTSPSFASTVEEYYEWLRHFPEILQRVDPTIMVTLMNLWQENRANIHMKESLNMLQRILVHVPIELAKLMVVKDDKGFEIVEYDNRLAAAKNAIDKSFLEEKISEGCEEPKVDLIAVLKYLGYNSLSDLVAKMHWESPLHETVFTQVQQAEHELKEQLRNDFDHPWSTIVENSLIGFDVSDARDRLKKQCEENHIEHKDFNDRNIIVEWDFEKDKPLIHDGETKPRVYLVDWEEKKSDTKE
jgi:hypothetical protein